MPQPATQLSTDGIFRIEFTSKVQAVLSPHSAFLILKPLIDLTLSLSLGLPNKKNPTCCWPSSKKLAGMNQGDESV